jgi:P-type E1-E2 ATPase
MPLSLEIPGRGSLTLKDLVLDVNGTLTDRGALIDGVSERLAEISTLLDVHVLSADTFGTLGSVAEELGLRPQTISTGDDKARFVAELGAERCVAIGNGANDASMLEAAALGIAVIGPEGAASSALTAADVVCASIVDALGLLLDERTLIATLRH